MITPVAIFVCTPTHLVHYKKYKCLSRKPLNKDDLENVFPDAEK